MNATTAAKNSARLDVGQLMAAAEAATGLSDWGTDRTFRIGLDKLVESMNGMDAPQALVQQAGMRLTGSRSQTRWSGPQMPIGGMAFTSTCRVPLVIRIAPPAPS